MNYLETVAYIDSLSPTLERPSLTRIALFMQELGDPQNQLPVFHIGGTNGKGSTVAILDSILRSAGLKVGRFTGPHLLRWNERFHIDGQPISDEELADTATEVRAQSERFAQRHQELGALTWFEFLTAIAFNYFERHHIQVAVMEVGLGGRFDATNIVTNVLASVITNIDLDHTHILGNTLEQIAYEKAGIMRAGKPVVTAAERAGFDELARQSKEHAALLYRCSLPDLLMPVERGSVAPFDRSRWGETKIAFDSAIATLALPGQHQTLNALTAVSALFLAGQHNSHWAQNLDHAGLSEELLKAAFAKVYWPGRMQIISQPEHNLVLDGAHNPAGVHSLRIALDALFPCDNFSFVLSCFGNKNALEMLKELVRPGDRVFISEAATRRATFPKEELAAAAEEMGATAKTFSSLTAAYEAASQPGSERGPVVATGSFATVREVMTGLGWHCVEDGQSECAKISSCRDDGAAHRPTSRSSI